MRAPAFWCRPRAGTAALLLAPIGAIYGAVTAWRMGRRGVSTGVPIICVGNFIAGGAGKTPTAITLAKLMIAKGEAPIFLTRGYGGTLSSNASPVLVDPSCHSASEVGDEPLLLARVAPTIVAARREQGARAAREAGASVIIMDDGLQNASLRKDMTIAVVDGTSGIGNGFSIPAGPLRAPIEAQLRYVDALALIGEGAPGKAVEAIAASHGKMVLSARLAPDLAAAAGLAGRRVIAFAGIGRPEKFFSTLDEIGAEIVARQAFADHHIYNVAEIADLRRLAEDRNALLVTTEKDAVRIAERECHAIVALPVSLIFEDAATVAALLAEKLATARRFSAAEPRKIRSD